MALRNEDKEWVLEQIRLATQRPEVHGLRKCLQFLREWSLVGTAIAVFLTLITLVVTVGIYAVSGRTRDAEFRGRADQRLETIETKLSGIEGTLSVLQAQIAAMKYSAIPPIELKQHHDELKGIRDKLASAPRDVPNFWPATFQIITLFSKANSDLETISEGPEGILDNVVSNPIGGMAPVENARVVLKNLIQGVIFKNSVVRFDPSIRLVNDVFINCVFIFPDIQNPPKPLQEIGKTLLASDLSKVTLNAS